MSASTNDKLDRAVSTVAENFSMNTGWIDSTVGLKGMSESGNTYATILSAVKKIMNGAKYDELNIATAQWNFDPTSLKDDGTWYTMAYVSRAMSDEYITELVADQLNAWAENMVDDEKIVNNANWDYTVSVAKADCLGGDDSVRSDDAVIIGVAITVTKTDVKY